MDHCTSLPREWPAGDPVRSPLLPFVKTPSQPKQKLVIRWDVLGGGFIVVVDLETHRPNEGNIFHPILGIIEKEVRDRLIWGDRSGGCGRISPPPTNLAGSLLEHSCQSLGRMEHAGDGFASIKMV